ncbi:hypothetical protein BpHYR1_051785, partial [Brachionus plicatilis]
IHRCRSTELVERDPELKNSIVKLSFQCIKYLSSNADREELRRLCDDSTNVALLSRCPTVILSKIKYQTIMMSIESKKQLLTALIPDMVTWGSHNA